MGAGCAGPAGAPPPVPGPGCAAVGGKSPGPVKVTIGGWSTHAMARPLPARGAGAIFLQDRVGCGSAASAFRPGQPRCYRLAVVDRHPVAKVAPVMKFWFTPVPSRLARPIVEICAPVRENAVSLAQ